MGPRRHPAQQLCCQHASVGVEVVQAVLLPFWVAVVAGELQGALQRRAQSRCLTIQRQWAAGRTACALAAAARVAKGVLQRGWPMQPRVAAAGPAEGVPCYPHRLEAEGPVALQQAFVLLLEAVEEGAARQVTCGHHLVRAAVVAAASPDLSALPLESEAVAAAIPEPSVLL
jgi:hypothetical protein